MIPSRVSKVVQFTQVSRGDDIDSTLEEFVVLDTGAVYHRRQRREGGFWHPWQRYILPTVVLAESQAAIPDGE